MRAAPTSSTGNTTRASIKLKWAISWRTLSGQLSASAARLTGIVAAETGAETEGLAVGASRGAGAAAAGGCGGRCIVSGMAGGTGAAGAGGTGDVGFGVTRRKVGMGVGAGDAKGVVGWAGLAVTGLFIGIGAIGIKASSSAWLGEILCCAGGTDGVAGAGGGATGLGKAAGLGGAMGAMGATGAGAAVAPGAGSGDTAEREPRPGTAGGANGGGAAVRGAAGATGFAFPTER